MPFSDLLRDLDRGAVSEVVVYGDSLAFKQTDGADAADERARELRDRESVLRSGAGEARRSHRRPNRSRRRAAYSYGALILGLDLPRRARRDAVSRHDRPDSGAREQDARGRSRGDRPVTFADVAGVDEAKEEVKEIVDFLREPSRFSAIGGRIPKGVLLVGPPGTGKTLLARSIAGEAKVPFLFASGSDFVEMYAGVGASRIRKLFKDARRHDVVHHLHRRARRGRPEPRRQLAQPRRARADAQSAARRDGRLRARTRASSSSPRPIVPTSSIRRCCVPAVSIAR